MHLLLASLAAVALAAAPSAPAAAPERAAIPERYRWNVAALYPSDAAWAEARGVLERELAGFERHRGKLGDSAGALAEALSDLARLRNALDRIHVYASMRSDEDTREARPRAMKAEADRLAVAMDAATSWLRPAILALPAARIRAFVEEEPRLADWAFFLEDLIRWQPHTLTPDEERIVAMTGDLAGAGQTLHEILTNADLPWPTVRLSTGETLRLDPTGYERGRAAPRRADRERVFRAFFGALAGYERTLGAALDAQVKGHVFNRDVRRFRSSLEAALFPDAVPEAVYHQLLRDVNANLGTLHRYLALRRRMLGVAELRYEDLYAPMARRVERRYGVDEAVALTVAAVAPLGGEYQAKLAAGLAARWTDFLPSPGKRSGAYSTGVYGVHPFQLLNFAGRWNDVSTLAHEAGHSMHTLLAAEHQPYPTAAYAIFVAEVASTLNELLLLDRALAAARDDGERLALLGEHLETMRTTLFRQTMFAEFELAYHRLAEGGEALTGERLSALYLALARRYYGHDEGRCRVADRYGVEWAYVPHFFSYDFYVFQYATSLVASTSIAEAIRSDAAAGRTDARDRFLALLAAGGSRHPVELLRDAGVDMTTSAPFRAAMDEMNRTMDRIEAILARRAPGGRP